ncbi:tRNA-specific adenosine deaminase 1 [Cimex lectularius]|uniref:tRNA-specific adenosine deaminase 1 n=1 Tax=Cimex lectularius TaxID=79782 RepID=A0A8I6REJ2_CIMLE|nr:tRNA-specific adenosine deaminase 1 [Cimex lectularius]XP_014240994.1 tRNA-specific adenosine deaminase 1 [Cimex lectularius]
MEIADKVASLIFSKYDEIDKKGKPEAGREWTLLSGFVFELNGNFKVVSLATGTKCLGKSQVCQKGTTVNDSHAEVLARRGLIRYLLFEVKETKQTTSSFVFTGISPGGKCVFKNGLKLHFFTSHVPCGDASIIDMPVEKIGEKRVLNDEKELNKEAKRIKLDIHRTGAKPLKHSPIQDPKQEGQNYHKRGAVRTKPGRGDPTDSLSCSDKIARWIFTGVQGALLSHLVDRNLHINSVIIGGGCQYDEIIIKGSLVGRALCASSPSFYQSRFVFKDSKQATKAQKPCPKSIIWTLVNGEQHIEVGVEGRKLGATKKNWLKSCLTISRRELFKEFLSVGGEKFIKMSYKEVKNSADDYKKLSDKFKCLMGTWAVDKSQMQNFSISTLD